MSQKKRKGAHECFSQANSNRCAIIPPQAIKRAQLEIESSAQTRDSEASNPNSSGPIHSALSSISSSSAMQSTSSSSPFAPAAIGPNQFKSRAYLPFYPPLSNITTRFAPVFSSYDCPYSRAPAPSQEPLSLSCSAFTPPSNITTLSVPAILISLEERSIQAIEIIEGLREFRDVFPMLSEIFPMITTMIFNHLIEGTTPPEMAHEIISKLLAEVREDPASCRWITPDYSRTYIHKAYAERNLPIPRDWEHWETLFFPIWIENEKERQLIHWFFGNAPSLQSRCSVNFSQLFPKNSSLKEFCKYPTPGGPPTDD